MTEVLGLRQVHGRGFEAPSGSATVRGWTALTLACPCSWDGGAYFSNHPIPTGASNQRLRNGTLRISFDWTDADDPFPTLVAGYKAPGMDAVVDSPRIARGETVELRIQADPAAPRADKRLGADTGHVGLAGPYQALRGRRLMHVLGFTGMPGSGKSEAMEVAKTRGIPVVRMGDLIWEEVERQGKPRDAKHVGEVANAMRASHGKDVWALRTCGRVREIVAGLAGASKDAPAEGTPVDEAKARSARLVLIDGIRSHEEVDTFRRELGNEFDLVAIHTDPEHRFDRMVKRARADDSADPAVLKARDEREMTWGIARTIALADEMVVNDGTLGQFRKKVEHLLDRLAKTS